jgi:protein AFG1
MLVYIFCLKSNVFLFQQPLGPIDFVEICKAFDVVMVRDIPQLSLDKKSEARRFITLIDNMYDYKVGVYSFKKDSP